VKISDGSYLPPEAHGFGLELKSSVIDTYRYPNGIFLEKYLSIIY